MLYLKIHDNELGVVVAMCDEKLIGKVLDDGKVCLDLKLYASFYKGDLMDRKKALKIITEEQIYSANVVGEESVSVAMEAKIVEVKNVKRVDGVPFAHAYKVDF